MFKDIQGSVKIVEIVVLNFYIFFYLGELVIFLLGVIIEQGGGKCLQKQFQGVLFRLYFM